MNIIKKLFIPFLILGLVAGISACGSKSKDDDSTKLLDPPTAQEVMNMLNKAMDPRVSKEEKINLVEDASKDPTIFDKLQEYKHANPKLDFEIGAITQKKDGNVRVQLSAYPEGKSNVDSKVGPLGVDLINNNGHWQLAKSMVCRLLGSNVPPIKSAICV